jgi:hypothetical protein
LASHWSQALIASRFASDALAMYVGAGFAPASRCYEDEDARPLDHPLERIQDLVSQGELRAISLRYQQTAGFVLGGATR